MTEIMATDVQAQAIAAAAMPIIVRDASGKVLGQLVPYDEDFSPEEIARALHRKANPGKRYTTAEVLDQLRSLAPE